MSESNNVGTVTVPVTPSAANADFRIKSISLPVSPHSSSYHHQVEKAPASIAKRHSRNQLSSTSSFPISSSPTAVDSPRAFSFYKPILYLYKSSFIYSSRWISACSFERRPWSYKRTDSVYSFLFPISPTWY